MPVETLIQVRRDLANNWFTTNPTLDVGEFGYETDTKKLKIGTGALWNNTIYTNDITLGGTGRTDGAAPPFLYYAKNGDYTLQQTGQTAGTITNATPATAKFFGVGATLASNTTYDVDIYMPLALVTSGGSTPQITTLHGGGLTLYGSGIVIDVSYINTTTAPPNAEISMTAQTRLVRYNSGTSAISDSALTGAVLSTANYYYFKIYLKGIIRTNAGGTWTPALNLTGTSSTYTSTTLRDGAYMRFTPITTGTASPTVIGSFS